MSNLAHPLNELELIPRRPARCVQSSITLFISDIYLTNAASRLVKQTTIDGGPQKDTVIAAMEWGKGMLPG